MGMPCVGSIPPSSVTVFAMCSGSYKGPLIKHEKFMTVIVKVNDPGYLGFVRVMFGLYWGHIGIMEKMETTI